MYVNFFKYNEKKYLKYTQKKKKQGIDIFSQIEAFFNSKLPIKESLEKIQLFGHF